MTKIGKLFVIEGTDGSGKKVQTDKLVARLKNEGKEVVDFDFPQYGQPSAYFVERYLRGEYGTSEEVGPYKASVFYAVDRFDVGPKIRKAISERKIAVSNRYVASNMGHQGAKIADPKERMKLFVWLDEFEHDMLGIPRPDLNIILHVPAEISQKLVDKKGAREYIGGKKRDIHEGDIKHLKQAEEAYLEMAKLFPDNFVLIECVKNGKLLSIEEIHEKVWLVVKKVLSQ